MRVFQYSVAKRNAIYCSRSVAGTATPRRLAYFFTRRSAVLQQLVEHNRSSDWSNLPPSDSGVAEKMESFLFSCGASQEALRKKDATLFVA